MPEQPPTLSDMILEAHESGIGYAELAERSSVDGRPQISGSQLQKLAQRNVPRIPTPEHLRGIAAALRVPYERVRQAAIAQYIPADDVEGAADLTPDERRQLREEVLRLRQMAEATLARIDGQTATDSSAQRKSA